MKICHIAWGWYIVEIGIKTLDTDSAIAACALRDRSPKRMLLNTIVIDVTQLVGLSREVLFAVEPVPHGV
jgi:hypothetical protein